MKVAIVGTGISGALVAALLHGAHDIVVHEADERVGGHTHTHDIEEDGPGGRRTVRVDTGFIVYNDWTYPNFIELLSTLGVATKASDMSFSVRSKDEDFEYNGHTLNTLFAQRSNILRPSFHGMILDILRFNKEARRLLDAPDDGTTLGEYLDRGRYGRAFVERYILPMAGAIWSADAASMREVPARWFARFFENHGMLSVDRRPTWRVIEGGSQRYHEALRAPWADRIRAGAPVSRIRRHADHVEVESLGRVESYDQVVVAAHSDQALAMLADPSAAEREVLGAIPYRRNIALLHVDEAVMPRRKLAWAAWNHHLGGERDGTCAVTYWMNKLQGLDARKQYFTTLNDESSVDPAKVLRRMVYHHPVYSPRGVAAQARWADVNGVRRTWYAGAWWGFGFHEDGVKSALAVAERFGRRISDLKAPGAAPERRTRAAEAVLA
jgi:predicted NAD/FAD-binding protein